MQPGRQWYASTGSASDGEDGPHHVDASCSNLVSYASTTKWLYTNIRIAYQMSKFVRAYEPMMNLAFCAVCSVKNF